jgi:hypothetical protein
MLILVVAVLGSLMGCGPSCRTSCERLYGSGTDACNIPVNGYEGEAGANSLIIECTQTCESAMAESGAIGTYDPNSKTDTKMSIGNEKQAAAWMDCVAETACDNIQKGFCQPHL